MSIDYLVLNLFILSISIVFNAFTFRIINKYTYMFIIVINVVYKL